MSRTLEVGCAYGMSSLYICEALRDRTGASHTIVDPMQMEVWKGIGVAQLERAGIDFFELVNEPSELALPALVRDGVPSFDLIFIDGWHTFDQVIVDLYYADRLLREGGYIVVDDCTWASVSMAVAYFANYPAYRTVDDLPIASEGWQHSLARAIRTLLPARYAKRLIPEELFTRGYSRIRYPSIVTFKKIARDDRSWTWFEGF